MKQEPPFAIQIELTEGCNLYCNFCGIQGIRKGPGNYKFMKLKTARQIAKTIQKANWNSRIEFAMHGEPTANPNYKRIFSIFRRYLKKNQFMITTNGFGLAKNPEEEINNLFEIGINIIAIDDYLHNKISQSIKKRIKKYHIYPEEKKYSPHSRYKKNSKLVIFIQDISQTKTGTHSILNNHCGNAFPPLKKPLNKKCAKPFREISVCYNGNINICCNDWKGIYKCGNIFDSSIEEIWNNKYFHATRKILYSGKRNFIPCKWCNAISYRLGLLPDKMGKQKMPNPTIASYGIAKKAAIKGE